MVLGFHRFGCPVAQGLVQALRVPPRDPPERRQFQIIDIREWLAPPDELGLVRAVGAFGHGVVVRVADRAGRGQHAVFLDPAGVGGAGVLRAMVAVMHEPVGAVMRRGPGDGLFQRLQRQLLGAHGGGARPAHDATGEHAGGERRAAERAVRHAHVGDVGHVQPVRRTGLELAFHQVRPSARALGGPGRHRGSAAAHAPDAEPAHDVHHLVAADLRGVLALGDQLGVRLPVPVHGHEEIRMHRHDGRAPKPRGARPCGSRART